MKSGARGKWGVLLLFTVFAGCSVFQSRKVENHPLPLTQKDRSGIAYFLPTGKIHIVAVKTEVRETNDVDQVIGQTSVAISTTNSSSRVTTKTVPSPGPVPSVKTNSTSTLTTTGKAGSDTTLTTNLQSTTVVETSPGSSIWRSPRSRNSNRGKQSN